MHTPEVYLDQKNNSDSAFVTPVDTTVHSINITLDLLAKDEAISYLEIDGEEILVSPETYAKLGIDGNLIIISRNHHNNNPRRYSDLNELIIGIISGENKYNYATIKRQENGNYEWTEYTLKDDTAID